MSTCASWWCPARGLRSSPQGLTWWRKLESAPFREPRLPLLIGGEGKKRELYPVAVEGFRQDRDFLIIRDPDPLFNQPQNFDMKARPPGQLGQRDPLDLPLFTDGVTQYDGKVGDGGGAAA
jgi:hypothetical protein